jgi:peptide/nickel transport system permease protein
MNYLPQSRKSIAVIAAFKRLRDMRFVNVVNVLGAEVVVALPALALALPVAASLERMQSQATAETLAETYLVAARARGAAPARLVWRDALKPSLRPVVSIYGLIVGGLLSGSFAVEIVTSWPGLGRLMFDGLRARDLYLVAGCAALGSLFLVAGSLLSDVALALIDPRLREAR